MLIEGDEALGDLGGFFKTLGAPFRAAGKAVKGAPGAIASAGKVAGNIMALPTIGAWQAAVGAPVAGLRAVLHSVGKTFSGGSGGGSGSAGPTDPNALATTGGAPPAYSTTGGGGGGGGSTSPDDVESIGPKALTVDPNAPSGMSTGKKLAIGAAALAGAYAIYRLTKRGGRAGARSKRR